MRKKILTFIQNLRALEHRRGRLLDQLLVDAPLLMAGLSRVLRTCGKATCHCARKPGHVVWVLATREGSQPRCQVVRQADVTTIRQRVEAYRAFRAALRELEAIHRRQKVLLRGLMKGCNVKYK